MSRYKNRRLIVLSFVIATIAFLLIQWKSVTDRGGQKPADPFRIAGNLYYVGANDVTAFLLTGPEGHVLIDGGYPDTAAMIIKNITKLGFNITDVKILLNSHAHFDHAGGLAALQRASGATLWVSEADADVVASGGDDPALGALRILYYGGLIRYPPPRVDHRFKDGEKVRLGPVELTAHITAGHTPGCTSWAFPVHDGARVLLAVDVCSLNPPPSVELLGARSGPKIRADFEMSFRVLRSLPADIFLTNHAKDFGRWRKFQDRSKVENPVAPFIDKPGYAHYIDNAEKKLREALAVR